LTHNQWGSQKFALGGTNPQFCLKGHLNINLLPKKLENLILSSGIASLAWLGLAFWLFKFTKPIKKYADLSLYSLGRV
jgi:hypothetical protein